MTNALGDQHYSKWESLQNGGQWFWFILPNMSLTWHKQHGAAIYEDVNSGEAIHHFVIFSFFVSLRSCRFTVLVRTLHPLVGVKVINWGLLMLHFKRSVEQLHLKLFWLFLEKNQNIDRSFEFILDFIVSEVHKQTEAWINDHLNTLIYWRWLIF